MFRTAAILVASATCRKYARLWNCAPFQSGSCPHGSTARGAACRGRRIPCHVEDGIFWLHCSGTATDIVPSPLWQAVSIRRTRSAQATAQVCRARLSGDVPGKPPRSSRKRAWRFIHLKKKSDLGAVLLHVLEDEHYRAWLAQRSWITQQRYFSWNVIAAGYVEFLKKKHEPL